MSNVFKKLWSVPSNTGKPFVINGTKYVIYNLDDEEWSNDSLSMSECIDVYNKITAEDDEWIIWHQPKTAGSLFRFYDIVKLLGYDGPDNRFKGDWLVRSYDGYDMKVPCELKRLSLDKFFYNIFKLSE